MSMFVRNPAGFFLNSRSMPIMAPQSAATPQRTRKGSRILESCSALSKSVTSFIYQPTFWPLFCSSSHAFSGA